MKLFEAIMGSLAVGILVWATAWGAFLLLAVLFNSLALIGWAFLVATTVGPALGFAAGAWFAINTLARDEDGGEE